MIDWVNQHQLLLQVLHCGLSWPTKNHGAWVDSTYYPYTKQRVQPHKFLKQVTTRNKSHIGIYQA